MRALWGVRLKPGYCKRCKDLTLRGQILLGERWVHGRGSGQGQAPWNRRGHSPAAPVSRPRGDEPQSASPGRPRQHAAACVCPDR